MFEYFCGRVKAVQAQLRAKPENPVRSFVDGPDRVFAQAGGVVRVVTVMGNSGSLRVGVKRVVQIQLI